MTNTGDARLIMVIEDEFTIRDTLRLALEDDGYGVITAQNGKEALTKLSAVKPHLILLDMIMPIMDGREFLDRVAEDLSLTPIPVLIVSGTADVRDVHGSVGFMRKPPDLDTLLALVAKYTMPRVS